MNKAKKKAFLFDYHVMICTPLKELHFQSKLQHRNTVNESQIVHSTINQ